MRHILALVVIVGMTTMGCAGGRILGHKSNGQMHPVNTQASSPSQQAAEAVLCSCDACCGGMCDPGEDPNCLDGYSSGDDTGSGGLLGGARGDSRCRWCGGAGCRACGGSGFCAALATGFCPHAGGYPEMPNFNPGPPAGQTAYPYYTARGPRDFLLNNPPSIGPY